jgi:hypothetical protein
MGLFDWLFKRGASAEQKADQRASSLLADDFLNIPSLQFFGPFSTSANGRYKLAWGSGGGLSTARKAQSRKSGRYLLLEGERVLVEGKMIRPDHGKVANNGSFVLCDMRHANQPSGVICAFDAKGNTLIKHTFKANIFNSGMSDDGRFAVCQTCGSHVVSDNSILAIFDLTLSREIAKWQPASGWAGFYEFPTDAKTIGLGYRDLGVCFYTMDGDFVDQNGWENTLLEKGDYGTALRMAEVIVKGVGRRMSHELSFKLISCIDRVAPQVAKADSRWQALALKLRGVCLDAHGTPQAALSCYDQALALDPKIGVRGRADQLRKKLAQPIV